MEANNVLYPREAKLSPAFSWTQTLLFHLAPGLVITAAFVLLAWLTAPLGWPPSLALLLTWLVIGIPLLVGILFRHRRIVNGEQPFDKLLLYRKPMSWREYAWIVPVLLIWSALASTLLYPLGESIRHALFPAWPEWLDLSSLAQDPARYASSILWIIVGLSAVLNIVVPFTEELYFRSFLLPRLPVSRRWAPLWSAILFSIYHFWNPWDVLGRIVSLLPVILVVQWKQNVYISILVHCLLNLLGTLGLAAVVLGAIGG